MKVITLYIFLFFSLSEISAQGLKYQDVSDIDYLGKTLIDSIRISSYEKGIEVGSMLIIFTNKIKIDNSNYKDKELLFLVSSTKELLKKIIIISENKILKDTLLEFTCLKDKEWYDLCFDTLELPLNWPDGIFLPELPSCWSGNNYFTLIYFETKSAYYFEVNILGFDIFLDNPKKKKKREEAAKIISGCLVELINKL